MEPKRCSKHSLPALQLIPVKTEQAVQKTPAPFHYNLQHCFVTGAGKKAAGCTS